MAPESRRRSRLELYIDIMRVLRAKGPLKLTHIMYKANVNCSVLKEYLVVLQERGLVEEYLAGKKRMKYRITNRGRQALTTHRVTEAIIFGPGLEGAIALGSSRVAELSRTECLYSVNVDLLGSTSDPVKKVREEIRDFTTTPVCKGDRVSLKTPLGNLDLGEVTESYILLPIDPPDSFGAFYARTHGKVQLPKNEEESKKMIEAYESLEGKVTIEVPELTVSKLA